MKRLSPVIFFIFLLLTGCSMHKTPDNDQENGPETAVRAYISAASQASWGAVKTLLSGEALEGMQQNTGRVRGTEIILSVKIKTISQLSDSALVYAEITKMADYNGINYKDLAAYEFRLQKADQWKIYKVITTGVMRPDLEPGAMPAGAGEKLKEFIELPVREKHDKACLYLAGPALASSLRFNDNKPPQVQPASRVLEITPAGVSDSYIVLKAKYRVELEGYKPATITAVADMINVSGEWKIINLDIVNMDKGEG